MKCVKNVISEEVRRVKNDIALEMVRSENFLYCPRSEWKLANRPKSEINQVEEVENVD